tara:strand:- start:269 stop:631 length:363 start_codon:yes stop_codon:yes gene_type:complete
MENKNNESGFNVAVICPNALGRSFVRCKDRQLIMESRKFGAIGRKSSSHPTLVAWLIALLIIFSEKSTRINLGFFCSLGQIFSNIPLLAPKFKTSTMLLLKFISLSVNRSGAFFGRKPKF